MNSKLKTDIALALFVIASFLLFFFLIGPSLSSARESGQNLLDLRQKSASIENQINSLEKFKERYEREIEPNLDKNQGLLIDSEDQASFPVLIENTAWKDNLKVDIFSVSLLDSTEMSEETWPSLNYRISLTGYFSDILRFIDEFSNLPYLIEIHSLNIAKINDDQKKNAKETENNGKVRADFNLKIYMQK